MDFPWLSRIRFVRMAYNQSIHHAAKDIAESLAPVHGRSGKETSAGSMRDRKNVAGSLIASAVPLLFPKLNFHEANIFTIQVFNAKAGADVEQ